MRQLINLDACYGRLCELPPFGAAPPTGEEVCRSPGHRSPTDTLSGSQLESRCKCAARGNGSLYLYVLLANKPRDPMKAPKQGKPLRADFGSCIDCVSDRLSWVDILRRCVDIHLPRWTSLRHDPFRCAARLWRSTPAPKLVCPPNTPRRPRDNFLLILMRCSPVNPNTVVMIGFPCRK
jgi:hypothetical protein